jgi:uncharacterized protein
MRIGVISDTHGLLRSQAVEALWGAEYILHAGDVGDGAILERLRKIAPVTAIRGNIDEGGMCGYLPPVELVGLEGHNFYMLHDGRQLDLDPGSAGIAAVISGHSHQPLIEWRKGVLFFNPGSAGPRRFKLPVSVGWIEVDGPRLLPRVVELEV